MNIRISIDRSAIRQRTAAALIPVVLSMLTALPSWAGDAQQCDAYSRLALNQRAIAKPLQDHGGTGDGCPGADGPRWSFKTEDHFKWCMEVEPAFAAFETKERKKFLLNCTRQKELSPAPERDLTSCSNFGALFTCNHSPDAQGLAYCNNDGNTILVNVNKIRADRTLLYDYNRDPGLYISKYYHHFNHWRAYECVMTTKPNGKKYWTLEGITKAPLEKFGVVEKPSKPLVDVSPKPPIAEPLPRGNADKLFKVRP